MRRLIFNKVDAHKSLAIILSIVLIALLLASFMLILNAFPNAENAYAVTEGMYHTEENDDKVDEVVKKIENIGKIEYTKETKESIDEARRYFDSLTDEQKALIPPAALDTLKEAEHSYNLRHGWGMTFFALGIIIAFVGFIYLLMFFAFNRYTIKDNKVIRVHFMGEECGQLKLLTYNLQIIYRTEEEVFRYKGFADKLIVKDEKGD